MILAHILSGISCGMAAAISAVLVDLSLWEVATAYTSAGSAGILISAWVTYDRN